MSTNTFVSVLSAFVILQIWNDAAMASSLHRTPTIEISNSEEIKGMDGTPRPMEHAPGYLHTRLSSSRSDEGYGELFESQFLFSDGASNNSIVESRRKVRSTPRVPEYMRRMYEILVARGSSPNDDFCNDKTYVSFPNQGGGSFHGCGPREAAFDFGNSEEVTSTYLSLLSAHLHVEILPGNTRRGASKRKNNSHRHRLRKYSSAEVTVRFAEDKADETMRKKVTVNETVEAVFDVTSLVLQWASEGEANPRRTVVLDLQLPVKTPHQKRICKRVKWEATLLVVWEDPAACDISESSYPEDDYAEVEDQSMAEGHSSEGRSRRSHPFPAGKVHKICRLVPLDVNFKDIGWDSWIISPAGYNAHTCKGECRYPLPHHHDPTNHALVTTLLRDFKNIGTGPCCVPTAYKPLQMLYYNTGNKIVLKEHEDMVATKCGCR